MAENSPSRVCPTRVSVCNALSQLRLDIIEYTIIPVGHHGPEQMQLISNGAELTIASQYTHPRKDSISGDMEYLPPPDELTASRDATVCK